MTTAVSRTVTVCKKGKEEKRNRSNILMKSGVLKLKFDGKSSMPCVDCCGWPGSFLPPAVLVEAHHVEYELY